MSAGDDFERRLATLDETLFDPVPALLSYHDRRALLACQLATRGLRPGYRYLEIGSYRGGSLQAHALDPRCAEIASIDTRTPVGFGDGVNPSSAEMIEGLRAIGGDVGKIRTIDGDSFEIDPADISMSPDLCFIDGLHTDEAVINDFRLCREVMGDSGAVHFHDSNVVSGGITRILQELIDSGAEFRAYNLPEIVFVIELGDFPMHRNPQVASLLVDNYFGFMALSRLGTEYRRQANLRTFRWQRAVKRTIFTRRITTGWN